MRNHRRGALSIRMQDIPTSTRVLIATAIAWNMAWKGVSLWHASRNGDKPWFVTLLLTNTLGVLDGAYLFTAARRQRLAQRTEKEFLLETGEPEQLGHPQET